MLLYVYIDSNNSLSVVIFYILFQIYAFVGDVP